MTQHIYKVVEEPGFLDVGYAYSISSEEHGEEENKYWHVYFQFHTFMGFDKEVGVHFGKVYLEGTIKGLSQKIKLEFPSEDSAKKAADLLIPVAESALEASKPLLKNITFIELGKSLL